MATLTAKKSYVKSDNTQATLRGGEFTFDLYEGDLTAEQLKGKQPIQTAKNGEDGTVTFPAINYTKPASTNTLSWSRRATCPTWSTTMRFTTPW